MESIEQLVTARMTARRIAQSDFDDLLRLNQDATVMATLGGVRSAAEVRQMMRDALEHWERHGYGIWIFGERDGGGFVGRAGLRRVTIEGEQVVELLYALMPEFWNRGIASEMAHTILDAAQRLALEEVVAFTLPSNRASRRVMEKAGFHYDRDITWAGLPHVLYRRKLR
jgi:ribosomal-protein-alanine N-acetyltransferase